MKKLLTAIMYLCLTGVALRAQTATLIFNDFGGGGGAANAGTYAPGATITFDITLTVSGEDPNSTNTGLSYWFETSGIASTNGYFTIVSRSFTGTIPGGNVGTSPFSIPIQNPNGNVIVSGGNPNDLGATSGSQNEQPPNLSYFVATITLQISGAAQAGLYTISTTTVAPHRSQAGNHVGMDFNSLRFNPAISYSVTIVPEPATWSLIALGGLGAAGLGVLRARRKS